MPSVFEKNSVQETDEEGMNEKIYRKAAFAAAPHSFWDYTAVFPFDEHRHSGCDRCDGKQQWRRDVGGGKGCPPGGTGTGQAAGTAVCGMAWESVKR